MYLTKEEVLNFPPECYISVFVISNAVFGRYACGISSETAQRIINDYNHETLKKSY